jgi:toxin YoeB
LIKAWDDDAWEDYLYWQTQDKKILRKINNLLKDIDRSPFDYIMRLGSLGRGTGHRDPIKLPPIPPPHPYPVLSVLHFPGFYAYSVRIIPEFFVLQNNPCRNVIL